MRGGRRSTGTLVAEPGVDPQYSGWDDPVVALRDALRHDSQEVEDHRAAWASWLRRRGVDTTWSPRLSIDDPRVGTLVVVEDPYDYAAPLPTVYGGGDTVNAPLMLSCDGARYWTTRNATVVGGSDFVRTRDGACWPALTPGVESVLVSNALDTQLPGWTPSFMIIRDGTPPPRRRILPRSTGRAEHRLDRAIALVGEHSFQYGHWLLDYLPRSLAVRELPSTIPVLVDADVAPNSLWWLHKVLPDRQIILLERGQSIDVSTLFVPLQRTFCPTGWIDSMELTPDVWASDPSGVAQLQTLVTAGLAVPSKRRRRRLWLGRRGGHRPFVNQQELFERMASHGFELVYTEDLSMPELQSLLNETQDVIAAEGSQVQNVMACSPGVRVLVLLGDDAASVQGDVAVYAPALRHEVALVAGHQVGPLGANPYQRHNRAFVVDPALLDHAHREFFCRVD